MTTISLAIVVTSIAILYRAAIEQDGRGLWEMAESHAMVAEAMYRSTGDSNRVLAILADANRNYRGIGLTGEYTIARLEKTAAGEDVIRFLVNREVTSNLVPHPVPFRGSRLDEPSRQGLSGKSGRMVGDDYRGVRVLAAFRPLKDLGWVIVAKMDLAEIRAPFIRAAVTAFMVAVVLIVFGTVLFFLVTNPIIREVYREKENYERLSHELKNANDELLKSRAKMREMNIEMEALLEKETIRNIVQGHELDNHRAQLEVSRDIQRSILPASMPKVAGLAVAARYLPMELVGGDFYDFMPTGANSAGFFISDVSGHGISAALISSMVKVAFAAQKEHAAKPSEVLSGINRFMPGNWDDHFLTAQYVYIDTIKRILRVSCAGHTPLTIHRRSTGEILEFQPKGGIIGWFPNAVFEEREMEIRSGDRIIMDTDGILEAMDKNQVQFGKKAFYELIRSAGMHTADSFIAMLHADVLRWTGSESAGDDLTLIVIDVL
jgi:serine phosphatase RsbU (regulator of sigma subunit)